VKGVVTTGGLFAAALTKFMSIAGDDEEDEEDDGDEEDEEDEDEEDDGDEKDEDDGAGVFGESSKMTPPTMLKTMLTLRQQHKRMPMIKNLSIINTHRKNYTANSSEKRPSTIVKTLYDTANTYKYDSALPLGSFSDNTTSLKVDMFIDPVGWLSSGAIANGMQ